MYYVYVHTSPNGKIYIGKTKDIERRWNNGKGYKENKKFYCDIEKYGWQNIKHEIIKGFQIEEDAKVFESVLISILNSEDENVGYNSTSIRESVLELYDCRRIADSVKIEEVSSEKNIFEQSGLPISECESLINQWIFSKKNRGIVHDKLIDDLTYAELSTKWNLSVRQLKNIVYQCVSILKEHIE